MSLIYQTVSQIHNFNTQTVRNSWLVRYNDR